MATAIRWLLVLAAIAAGTGFWLTAPETLEATELAAIEQAEADPERGRQVFWAAGCASCHIAPQGEESDAPVLSGGQPFATQFGTFYAPNISPDPDTGIGSWTRAQFANAVKAGVTPDGSHYYPAFPYAAYANAAPEDIAALYAFMMTLPPDATPSRPHEVGFPFNIRRSLGGWKFLFLPDGYVTEAETEALERGRYLAEALAHCAECHTPRNALGGLDTSRWMGGAPNPNGKGRIPNITPAALQWSEIDLKAYLTTGLTPEYDSAGGHMASVVTNLARLPEADIDALVSYVQALPPVADPPASP